MKRLTKNTRSINKLSPEKAAEIKQLREKIDREEKLDIMGKLRTMKKQRQATEAELTKTCELLKSERESQGKSLADVQELTGISRAAICRLENLIDANPTVVTLDRIAAALGKKLVVALTDRVT